VSAKEAQARIKINKLLEEAGVKEIHPTFLYRILKSEVLIEKYKTLGNGSIKRRKSISFDKFSAISIPIPPNSIQQKVVEHSDAVLDLERAVVAARAQLSNEIENTLHMVGLV
jgi:restriction endonuclease S subunit